MALISQIKHDVCTLDEALSRISLDQRWEAIVPGAVICMAFACDGFVEYGYCEILQYVSDVRGK